MSKYLFAIFIWNSTNFCLATRNPIFDNERYQTDVQFFWVKLVFSVVSWNVWANLKHWSHWKITRIILWWSPWIQREVFGPLCRDNDWPANFSITEKLRERIVAWIFIFTQVSNAEHKFPPEQELSGRTQGRTSRACDLQVISCSIQVPNPSALVSLHKRNHHAPCYLLLVPWYMNRLGHSPSFPWGPTTCHALVICSLSLARHPDRYP